MAFGLLTSVAVISAAVNIYSYYGPGIRSAQIFEGFGPTSVPCGKDIMVLLYEVRF
jgi:hypothetical protein